VAYVLFHIPSGMFADQDGPADTNGNIRTSGFSYANRDDALADYIGLSRIGCNPMDWLIVEKPEHVTTSWVV
jgi:hypothetical protein